MTTRVGGKASLRSRFAVAFRDPVVRANILALAGGKFIGLTLVLTAMAIYLPPALHAQAAPPGRRRRSTRSTRCGC